MNLKDRRSVRKNRLLIKKNGYQVTNPLLALDAGPLEDVTSSDEFYRVKGNEIIFSKPIVDWLLTINLPDKHRPLLVLKLGFDRLGVIHTDGNKLYATLKQKYGESRDYKEEQKTFDFGSPSEVQVFDKAIAFKNRTGKWQVIPNIIDHLPDLDKLNQTKFKDYLRDHLPYLDPKKDGELYGVLVSEYDSAFLATVTNLKVTVHGNGTASKYYKTPLDLDQEKQEQMKRDIEQGVPFKGAFTSKLAFLIGRQLQLYDTSLSTRYIRVQRREPIDDVDEVYQDTNNSLTVRKGKSLYFIDFADASSYIPDLVKDRKIKVSRLDGIDPSLIHVQYVPSRGGTAFVLQYPSSLKIVSDSAETSHDIMKRLIQHNYIVPIHMPVETFKKLVDMFPELVKEGKLC